MSGAVFMITVTGEMSETLRDQFDDVQLIVGHGVSHFARDELRRRGAARPPAPARRAGPGAARRPADRRDA